MTIRNGEWGEIEETMTPDHLASWRVYREGEWPKPKRWFYPNEFPTRRKARAFCRNRVYERPLYMVNTLTGEVEVYE